MRLPTLAFAVLSVVLLLPGGPAGANEEFQYVIDDFSFYPPPDLPKPDKGVTFQDPHFHIDVTRITDAAGEAERDGRSCFAGYPKHDIENSDGTLLLVEASCSSNWGIYDAVTFEKLHCLPPGDYGFYKDSKSPIDPRWDDEDPDKLYFIRRMTFNYYNVQDGQSYLLHDFREEFPEEENIYINLAEEGDGSVDRRYWAFGVTWHQGSVWKCYNVVTYDAQNDEVLGILPRPEGTCGNWVSATPLGKAALGTSPILIYDMRFENPPVEINASGGIHGDFAVDDEGREVYFHGKDGWWRMEDLATGETTNLAPKSLGPGMSYHISGNAFDRPGWGLVSTYPYGQVTPTHWADYSIFLVELTRRQDPPPRVWRIVHTHTADKEEHSYGADPFGKFNTRGTKIFFTSNWGDPEGLRDIYQVDLPPGWHEELQQPLCTDGQSRECGIDVGACQKGFQECIGGTWGSCTGAIDPVPEVCGDAIDNDCDGVADEGCGQADGGAADGTAADAGAADGGKTDDGTAQAGDAAPDSPGAALIQGGCSCGTTQDPVLLWFILPVVLAVFRARVCTA